MTERNFVLFCEFVVKHWKRLFFAVNVVGIALIFISFNYFEGTIPFDQLGQLVRADLSNNNFKGQIPASVCESTASHLRLR
jgi:hypothetical protein